MFWISRFNLIFSFNSCSLKYSLTVAVIFILSPIFGLYKDMILLYLSLLYLDIVIVMQLFI